MWFGRDELDARWRYWLILTWILGLVGSAFVPGGKYIFMALIAVIDIGLILAIFGGDIEIH